MKRKVALGFLLFLIVAVGGTLATLRTRWAGDKICAVASEKLSAAFGKPVDFGSCRIDPFALTVSARNVRVGDIDAPLFVADELRAKLAPLQALGRKIHLDELVAVRPRIRVPLDPASTSKGAAPSPPVACPPAALSQFELHHLEVTEGSLELALAPGRRVSVSRFDIHSEQRSAGSLRGFSAKVPTTSIDIEVGESHADLDGRRFGMREGRLQADMPLDLSRAVIRTVELDGEGMALSARGTVVDLCQPSFQGSVALNAPLPAIFSLAGRPDIPSSGRVSLEVDLTGPLLQPSASGNVQLSDTKLQLWGKQTFEPKDARVDFSFAGSDLVLKKVQVPIGKGQATVTGLVKLGRAPVLANAEVETRDVEFAEVLSRVGIGGAFVMMRHNVKGHFSGPLYPLALKGTFETDVDGFRVLDHAWEPWKPGDPTVLEAKKGRVEGQIKITPDGVRFDNAKVKVGTGVLTATVELHPDPEKGFWVDADGTVDLDELRHIAVIPWEGKATVAIKVRAPRFPEPRIDGTVKVQGFHFSQFDLGDMGSEVAFTLFTLRLNDIHGQKGETRYGGNAVIDLARQPVMLVSSHLDAEGKAHDLFDAVIPYLPQAKVGKDSIDGKVKAALDAHGPVPWFDATFDATLGEGQVVGRRFERGRLTGEVLGGRKVRIDLAQLERGTASASGSGMVGIEKPWPWDLQARFHGLPLGELDLAGGPYEGSVSGTATLAESFDNPAARFAANGDGVKVHGVPVGTTQVGGFLRDGRLALTGTTEGVKFSASADLDGRMPFKARAEVDVEDVTRYLPGGPPAGLRAAVDGLATAEGFLDDLGNAKAHLTFPHVRGGYGDFKVDNKETVAIGVDRGRVAIESFTLRGPNTEFALGGSREDDGRLAMNATGSIDLRLLGGVFPALQQPRGQLQVQADISGTALEPLLVGNGNVKGGAFKLAGVPITFAGIEGDLSFSQNRVIFDDVPCTVNGGRTELRGEVELRGFLPSRVRIDGTLDEVPMRIPDSIPAVVSGDMSMWGSLDAMTLGGKLHVLRARYTEKVDLEKSLLEFRRKHGMVAKVYEKQGDWLKFDIQLLVDGDARVENDIARGGVKGDLTVTGTPGGVGLVGTLTMVPGAKAIFRGNEFLLTHAVVDFTERHRVHAAFDVHGEAPVRDYRVYMHYFGTLEDPQLQLTSTPALSQQDIVTLLSLGFTAHDAAAGAGVSGAATAAAAQALFSASGLDDQVKRFLPREGVFKDIQLGMRITSSYSEGTGQIEPRAELESKLLHDRLRLRYQAPLSSAKGQRAQAELKLNEHTSVQYQWDSNNPDVVTGGDHGVDLKLRWEWAD